MEICVALMQKVTHKDLVAAPAYFTEKSAVVITSFL